MGYPRDPCWGFYFTIQHVLFKQKYTNFAPYVDDNTPYVCDKNLEVTLSNLQICALKLLEWFSNNYMKMNFDKCHLILSSNDKN